MSKETHITSRQMSAFLKLVAQAGVTPGHFQKLLETGVIAAVLDRRTEPLNFHGQGFSGFIERLRNALRQYPSTKVGESVSIHAIDFHGWGSWSEALKKSGFAVDPEFADEIRGLTMNCAVNWYDREGFQLFRYEADHKALIAAERLIGVEGFGYQGVTPLQLLRFAKTAAWRRCEGKTVVATNHYVYSQAREVHLMTCLKPTRDNQHQVSMIRASSPIAQRDLYVLARHTVNSV